MSYDSHAFVISGNVMSILVWLTMKYVEDNIQTDRQTLVLLQCRLFLVYLDDITTLYDDASTPPLT